MIIGFGFTKVLAEKKKGIKGNINISNNVGIVGIEEVKLTADPKKTTIRTKFKFESKYEPDIGGIYIEGEVVSLLDKKVGEDLVKQWEKEKKLPAQFLASIINPILDRCNIQSLILCKDLNLPAPIPLPKVNVQTKPKEGKEKK